jgi:hypothetical protein
MHASCQRPRGAYAPMNLAFLQMLISELCKLVLFRSYFFGTAVKFAASRHALRAFRGFDADLRGSMMGWTLVSAR